MKKVLIILTVGLLTFNINAEPYTASVSGFIGKKSVDDSAWKPFEEQLEMGVVLDFKPARWPVSIVVGFYSAADADEYGNDNETHGFTQEWNLGLRKTWSIPGTNLHPYYGMGAAYIWGEMEDSTGTQEDKAIGYWAGTGIRWTITQHFDVGIEGRYSQADIEFSGADVEAGGTHLGFTLGYNW